ncbi:baseplate J/gp47 family protein [Nitrosomonas sp. Nm132]|uniref:baseplate J/gp47 family protein n=1 Tax=Nitrosomonas sp. Nm132 TaxID=1881053 RepID=UPI00087EE26F|nr:baseplate J/gp47 family protein [Nitrosomonas sp. Nm132]SDH27701.1 Baseplate J-like protein [Nitrosomonas sp. Nm132]
MFQIKDFRSCVASMINWMKATQEKITDFNVGSVARTLVEAPAVEIEELYQQFFIGLREAIPVALFRAFNFERLPAALAVGTVTVTQGTARSSDLLIPEGTVFLTIDGREYKSVQDVTWLTGTTFVQIQVEASLLGMLGNTSAGTIVQSSFFDSNVVISNLPINNGRDDETEEERKIRFSDFILSLSRGTLAAIKFAVASAVVKSELGETIEYVARIGIEEEIGHVDIHIYGSGGIASDALVTQAQMLVDGYELEDGTKIPGYRSAGIRVTVMKMTEQTINVTMNVSLFPGYSLTTALINEIKARIETEFDSIESGSVLYMKSLTDAALSVAGIKDIFVSNESNIICGNDEVLRLGDFTVIEVNV